MGHAAFITMLALPAIERGYELQWMLRLKSNPAELIGGISLMKRDIENRGFWLGLAGHGRGLISEACEVVTDYWFDILGFSVLCVPKAVANTASRRVSEKQGMRIVATEDRDYVSGRLPSEVWEITAEEWRARKRSE